MHSLADTAKTLFGVSLNGSQIRALETYADELADWNRRVNLTAITDRQGIETKHFLDSLSCLKVMRISGAARVVDVGTGAGFPGLPLKIAVPGIRLTLVEATGKKAEFCRHIIDRLQLRDAEVVHARAEEAGQDPALREQFDWALARAVAELPVLAEYLMPLVKVGGFALAQKGESGPAEAHAAEGALRLLGGAVVKVAPVELPGVPETRYLVVMAKTACTPPEYPRRPGLPSKKPLGMKQRPVKRIDD
jgi:16S rRNA (guanine527-N7)-methyltransferase